MNKTEAKEKIAKALVDLTHFSFDNSISPKEAYKIVSSVIDDIFDEQFKYIWHTEAPKENGTYLIQMKDIHGVVILAIANLNCGCWALDSRMLEQGFYIEAWTELPDFYEAK